MEIICVKCGSTDKSFLRARPMQRTKDEFTHFEGPWSHIPFPYQGTVAMYGGPGTGKSSLSSLIRPKYWLTKEQEPKPASMMFRRVTPDHMPEIIALDDAEEVRSILDEIQIGPVVIDSLTAVGLKESLEIAHLLVNWSRQHGQKAVAILQANQGGGAAGYLEIPHLFDAVISVQKDLWGVRVFRIEKSRWCGLESIYFTFDDDGKITSPTFEAAYTVEGTAGEYYLHPYPINGAKWQGLFDQMIELNCMRTGIASCAQTALYMPSGFIEPMDMLQRKRFAEQAGLKWISPSDVAEDLVSVQGEE